MSLTPAEQKARDGPTGSNHIDAARFELRLIEHSLPNDEVCDEVCDEGHENTSTSPNSTDPRQRVPTMGGRDALPRAPFYLDV
jgi:hypothetical protein